MVENPGAKGKKRSRKLAEVDETTGGVKKAKGQWAMINRRPDGAKAGESLKRSVAKEVG